MPLQSSSTDGLLQCLNGLLEGENSVFEEKVSVGDVVIVIAITKYSSTRGGARNFPTGGLNLPTRGLKYGFQGTINAKNLRKIAFHLPTGASMLRRGAIAPSPPLAPPLVVP